MSPTVGYRQCCQAVIFLYRGSNTRKSTGRQEGEQTDG